MPPNLQLVPVIENTAKRKKRVGRIIDKVIDDNKFKNVLTETPRAQIEHNILLYKNLVESTNTKDILICIQLAENIREQSEALVQEAKERRNTIVRDLGGTIA